MTPERARIARRLHRDPGSAAAGDEALIHALLVDPQGDPRLVERAGWRVLDLQGRIPANAPEAADWIETDALARALLTETQLTIVPVERLLTAMRRWLLIEGRTADFPLTTAALIAQAGHNGGVWLFDETERAALESAPDFVPAYLPEPPRPAPAPDHGAPVTRIVAERYTEWPYPVWQRVLAAPRETLWPGRFGPNSPTMPADPDILVAGCGTGREALRAALRTPAAHILAIDLSATSLDYARSHCAGAPNIEFRQHDLHRIADLGRSFDRISCCGVLHHLPDPEAGWAALTAVLRPGGTMRVMLYSKIARLQVEAARRPIRDLVAGQPVTADLIRATRARLMDDPIARSVAFYSMGGVQDLLLHPHEDPFDIPRIGRALRALGLELLGFSLPSQAAHDAYVAANPHDPHVRDLGALAAHERAHPRLFDRMYEFNCLKP